MKVFGSTLRALRYSSNIDKVCGSGRLAPEHVYPANWHLCLDICYEVNLNMIERSLNLFYCISLASTVRKNRLPRPPMTFHAQRAAFY